jgi:hypothetical protein
MVFAFGVKNLYSGIKSAPGAEKPALPVLAYFFKINPL